MSRGGIAVVVALALALAGCGEDEGGPSTFEQEGFPFTFEYPEEFEVADDVNFEQSLGSAADENVAVALEENDGIFLQRITLNQEVTAENLSLAKQELDALIAQADPGSSPGTAGETAGFPSLEYGSLAATIEDQEVKSRVLVLFEGDQQYVINCQATEENREEVEAACDQMRATLAPAG